MYDAYHRKRNVILGDEMGLGKTAQTLALLECGCSVLSWKC